MNKVYKIKQHGQSMVEFALLLVFIPFIAMLIFDFGRAVYYYNTIHNASREGARYGIIHPDDDTGMRDAAENYIIGLGLDNVTIDSIAESSVPVGGSETYSVSVTIHYCFIPVTPLVEVLLTKDPCGPCGCNRLQLTSNSVMRTEAKPSQ